MGKEAKYGLTLIAMLLVIFCVALYQRFSDASNDAAASTELELEPDANADTQEDVRTAIATDTSSDLMIENTSSATRNDPAESIQPPPVQPESMQPESMQSVATLSMVDVTIETPTTPPLPDGYVQTAFAEGYAGQPPATQPLAQVTPSPGTADIPINSDPGMLSPNAAVNQYPPPNNAVVNQYPPSGYAGSSSAYPPTGLQAADPRPVPGEVYGSGLGDQRADIASPIANDGSYLVQPNDNYWAISQRLYGTGAYFRALGEHNRKLFPDANQLQPGQKIAAPSVAELLRNYRDLCPKPEHREVVQHRESMISTISRMAGTRVYVVQEGDTLFDVARHELGKASRWGEIFQINRNALGDQYNYLAPGMQILLPANTTASEAITQRPGESLRR